MVFHTNIYLTPRRLNGCNRRQQGQQYRTTFVIRHLRHFAMHLYLLPFTTPTKETGIYELTSIKMIHDDYRIRYKVIFIIIIIIWFGVIVIIL